MISHQETEDYGGYLTREWFLDRFIGKSSTYQLKMVKIIDNKPDEIVAITGASKTSKAVVDGVNLALENFNKIKGGK